MMWMALALLPVPDAGLRDDYDAVIWNVYRMRKQYHTQLLFVTYTRVGWRVEDWRGLSQPPIVKRRPHGVVVIFDDPRDNQLRRVYARTYSVVKSAFDMEMRNRDRFPQSHRRPLTKSRIKKRSVR